eukprot:gene10847-16964_t
MVTAVLAGSSNMEETHNAQLADVLRALTTAALTAQVGGTTGNDLSAQVWTILLQMINRKEVGGHTGCRPSADQAAVHLYEQGSSI